MKLNKLIEKLAAYEPDGQPFITLYLDARANNNGREDYEIWLKKEISEAGENYREESPEAESFKKTIERIQQFLDNEVDPAANGVAVFASGGEDGFFETAQLDVEFPNNRLLAYDRPHLLPLVRLVEQNPKYMVLWSDTNKADIYIFGGENTINIEMETKAKVEEIDNVVTQGTKVGGWSQGRYERHIENFHLQHAKETVEEVEKIMRDAKIKHLILCGDERTIIPILRPQLSKAVEESVVATLNLSQYDSEEEIHEKTHEVMTTQNAVWDMEKVQQMYDAAKAAAGLGAMGVENTLEALSNGQVQELIISSNVDALRYSPKKVKKILKTYAVGEDHSTSDDLPSVRESRQVADELLIRAMNTDAKIVFVEDEATLKEAGGVGAILRFNMNATANNAEVG